MVAVHVAMMPSSGRYVMSRYAVGSPLLELKVLFPVASKMSEYTSRTTIKGMQYATQRIALRSGSAYVDLY